MDAEQLRRGVLEPWCNKCGAAVVGTHPTNCHNGMHIRPALWTRCPELRPEGLTHCAGDGIGGEGAWRLDYGEGNVRILPRQAAALIGFGISTAMARASNDVDVDMALAEALACDEPTRALVALRHRWLDSLEQQEKQT